MTHGPGIDAFCLGYGGWISEETADPEAFNLAAAVFHAEAEWREGSWDALAVVLDHVVDGSLRPPADPAEHATLFHALWRLGWLGVP